MCTEMPTTLGTVTASEDYRKTRIVLDKWAEREDK